MTYDQSTPSPNPDAPSASAKPPQALAHARVLVTGASGFIGSALAQRMAALGCELHCTARDPSTRGDETGPGMRATWWPLDLTEREATDRVVQAVGPDYVFHLASRVTGARELDAVAPLFQAECGATVNLLEALARAGCRRVICSGSAEEPAGAFEQTTVASPYAAAKASSRIYQLLFDQLYELPVVNARIAMAYGPGQRDGSKLVPYVTRSFLSGTAPRLTDGSREADWIYIDDVVDALIRLATTETVSGQAVDVGTGILTPVREVVDRLRRLTGTAAMPSFGALPPRPLEQSPKADVERTARLTGWRPSVGLDEGLSRTVRAHAPRTNGPQLVASP